jgi:hypothetical protein
MLLNSWCPGGCFEPAMTLRLRLLQVALVATLFLFGGTALADKVAVLPFQSVGGATSVQLDGARAATGAAVVALAHKLPTDSEMLTAVMSAKDGVPDTSQEYRAAGRASSSDWTVAGRMEQHETSYRLELEVCQVDSGRVESLAREIDPAQAQKQIGEMLVLLLRPGGIGNSDIPWEHGQPRVTPPAKPSAPPPPAVPPPPPPPPATRHVYAEGHPFGIGVGGAVLGALHRAPNAVGSSLAGIVEANVGYALQGVPGLELRGTVGGAVAGPESVSVDAGARYAIPLVPTQRLFFGPEVALGGFFTVGAEKTSRFLLHPSAFVSWGLGERVQIEVAGDLEYAAGGSASLLLAGGTLRCAVRF